MAQGRKPADGTLQGEFEHAMDIIDGSKTKVALFLIGGHVRCTKLTSMYYGPNMRKHKDALIGVYDQSADARSVLDDIRVMMTQPGVDIDAVHARQEQFA